MPTYNVTGLTIGSFLLGEADKVLTIFTAEKGIIKAVAKSARKPGTKMAGRSDLLALNRLTLATGRTFHIVTQAETVESFPEFRQDLTRLAYGLYYAELTAQFATGLEEDCSGYLEYLVDGLRLQARSPKDPAWLCLNFEMGLLDLLGYKPELTYCVGCRDLVGEYNLQAFNREAGGVLCQSCGNRHHDQSVGEVRRSQDDLSWHDSVFITPLVWKLLIIAGSGTGLARESKGEPTLAHRQALQAARRLIQQYIEHRAGKHMKALDLIEQIKV